MKKLRCLIADDEPIARQILEGYIAQIPNLELVASVKNAFEVMEVLQKHHVDLLLLDINMPKLSGLGLLKTLHKKPEVIITTAYAEYAVEGFELSVTDYLLKPFPLERFLQAILKVRQKLDRLGSKEEDITSLFVKSDKKIVKIDFNEIQYIEAYGNYTKVFTEKMILTPQTLTGILEKLPSNFIRIHKSFVINFKKLKHMESNQIVLQCEARLPIGKSFKNSVLDRIT